MNTRDELLVTKTDLMRALLPLQIGLMFIGLGIWVIFLIMVLSNK